MKFKSKQIKLEDTHAFTKLILDYINKSPNLSHLVSNFPSEESLKEQIELKRNYYTHRAVLYTSISKQYEGIEKSPLVEQNLHALQNDNTFTICTAHQPSLFTGQLYFIYKIAHAITLARHCQIHFPDFKFVPIFYMGSEDDDMKEIGSFFYHNKNFEWQPDTMAMSGRLSLESIQDILKEVLDTFNPTHAEEKQLIEILTTAYRSTNTLAQGTRILLNYLFGEYGVLVVDGDDAGLKKIFSPVIHKEIESSFSEKIISNTLSFLRKNYHVQASARSINLFYIKENSRERIETKQDEYVLTKSREILNKSNLLQEARQYPERFSPNVILRPLYQEMILPNVAFVGGGGELAYWLQLKSIFDDCRVPYPLLILRNSFLVLDKKKSNKFNKLNIPVESLFESTEVYKKSIIKKDSLLKNLQDLFHKANDCMDETKDLAKQVNINLIKSVEAHLTKMKRIQQRLNEKFASHINKQYEWEHDSFLLLKSELFPENQLQERHDNFLSYFKLYHHQFIHHVIEAGSPMGGSFTILMEEE